jgi:hypothetical protein
LLAVVLALAACGGGAKHAATTTASTPSPCTMSGTAKRQIAKANVDLAKLKAVAARQTRYTELGTKEMQAATGRFLDDLTNSKIDNYRVNRMIDLGVSTASPYCGQCFQMLEAARPIPAMKYNPTHC